MKAYLDDKVQIHLTFLLKKKEKREREREGNIGKNGIGCSRI